MAAAASGSGTESGTMRRLEFGGCAMGRGGGRGRCGGDGEGETSVGSAGLGTLPRPLLEDVVVGVDMEVDLEGDGREVSEINGAAREREAERGRVCIDRLRENSSASPSLSLPLESAVSAAQHLSVDRVDVMYDNC